MIKSGDTVYYIGGQDEEGTKILSMFGLPKLVPFKPYKVEGTAMRSSYNDRIEKWSLGIEGYTNKIAFAAYMFKKQEKNRKK